MLHHRDHHHEQRPRDGAQEARPRRTSSSTRPTTSSARPAARSPRCGPTCSCSSTPRSGRTSSARRARRGSGSRSRTAASTREKMSRYRALFRAIGNPLRRIDCFLMRSDEEAERVLALGAAPDRVWVTGNTKFDALVLDGAAGARGGAARRDGARPRRAGVHGGLDARGRGGARSSPSTRSCAPATRGLQLVIAPRYLERAGRDHGARRGGGAAGAPAERRGGRGPGRRDRARHHRRARRGLPARDARLRGRQLRHARRARTCSSRPRRGSRCCSGRTWRTSRTRSRCCRGAAGCRSRPPSSSCKVADELLSRPDQIEELGTLARRSVGAIRGASARNVEHMLAMLPRGKAAA